MSPTTGAGHTDATKLSPPRARRGASDGAYRPLALGAPGSHVAWPERIIGAAGRSAWVLVALPTAALFVAQELADRTGVDVVALVAPTQAEMSPRKLHALQWITWSALLVALTIVAAGITRSGWRRAVRWGAECALAALLALAVANRMLAGSPVGIATAWSRFRVIELLDPRTTLQAVPELRRARSMAAYLGALDRSLDASLDRARIADSSTWPIASPKLREALATLTLVGAQWPFGDPRDVSRVGCTTQNALRTPESIPPQRLDGAAFLGSPVGCCADFALLYLVALRHRGFDARSIESPGHWLVELTIDGETWTTDPTTLMAFRGSVGQIARSDSVGSVRMYKLPLVGLADDRTEAYRFGLYGLRAQTLFRLTHQSRAGYSSHEWVSGMEHVALLHELPPPHPYAVSPALRAP